MAIIAKNDSFTIETKGCSYKFSIVNGIPVHHYYGDIIPTDETPDYFMPTTARSFAPAITNYGKHFAMNSLMLESSPFDSGDWHFPSVKMTDSEGRYIYNFVYDGFEIVKGRVNIPNLPNGRPAKDTETLVIKLVNKENNVGLNLYYAVYADTDVIVTHVSIVNNGDKPVYIKKAYSSMTDMFSEKKNVLTLQGKVTREKARKLHELPYGNFSICSNAGFSSHAATPFMVIADKSANENQGECYGVNLVYSGNFKAEACYDELKRLRFGIGINDDNFSYELNAGETFYTPEAIKAYTTEGFNGISIKMSDYIREYIMPEKWAYAHRPVVINTWEAFFFDINEEKMYKFAEIAKDTGIDTLVVDDGWFSTRRDDTSGLGDWTVAKEIFPSGVKNFVKKVKEIGLNTGIWIEPEMVNPNSELFRTHPEWALGTTDITSRQQMVLDMTNPEVVDYIADSIVKSLKDSGITYIKWDANRYICPFLSTYTKNSAEVGYKYMLGVYKLVEKIMSNFPDVMLEMCSGGGGRFDAGMLNFAPQIWASDNTCPFERAYIQSGMSYAYPVSSMSCHVTMSENGGTQLKTTMPFRFGVAINGPIGYEFDMFKLTEEELGEIKKEVEFYHTIEDIMLKGDFYRLTTPFDTPEYYAFITVAKDKSVALFSFNTLVNTCNSDDVFVKLYGLDDNKIYQVGDYKLSGKTCRCAGVKVPRPTRSGDNYTVVIKECK